MSAVFTSTFTSANTHGCRYVVDTPGVMLPLVESETVGLKLALVGALRDEQVGHELIADYLLFTLNRRGQFKYVCRPSATPHARYSICVALLS